MGTFVFAVCGNLHAARAATAIRILKKYSRSRIILITTRCTEVVDHDNVISIEAPAHLDDTQASRYLKTSVHRFVDWQDDVYCYLDSDVLAVSPDVDRIFDHQAEAIRFGLDYGKPAREFSAASIRDHHQSGDQITEAIYREFNLDVDPDWPLWNGGVFVFNKTASAFLDTWHDFTMRIFDIDYWAVRDQGTLIATAWKMGLKDQPPIPDQFNWLVRHTRQRGDVLKYNDGCFEHDGDLVHFLHFIHKKYTWELALALKPTGISPRDYLSGENDSSNSLGGKWSRIQEWVKASVRFI